MLSAPDYVLSFEGQNMSDSNDVIIFRRTTCHGDIYSRHRISRLNRADRGIESEQAFL